MDPQDATPFDCADPPIAVGEKIRNKLNGKVYTVRELRFGVVIVQKGTTALKLKLENVEPIRD